MLLLSKVFLYCKDVEDKGGYSYSVRKEEYSAHTQRHYFCELLNQETSMVVKSPLKKNCNQTLLLETGNGNEQMCGA